MGDQIDFPIIRIATLKKPVITGCMLIEDFVGLRRPMSRVSLQDVMGRTLQSIRGKAAEKKISLKILCEEDTSLLCDEKWTVEALFNVLDNAIKYSSSGSVVTVNSERFEIYTKIEIKDEGIGISPEHAADVCKRFFREEKAAKTEGVGIGLYLTREILEKENGYQNSFPFPRLF